MDFSFSHPMYLNLLLLLPVLILIHFVTLKMRAGSALKFANFESLRRIGGVDVYSKNIVVLVLSLVIILFLTLALAGMKVSLAMPVSSFSFVLALDSSGSMAAQDFSPNRLEASKTILEEFVMDTPSGTVVGVVSFAGAAIIEQELTNDKSLVIRGIRGIELSSGGTNLMSAVDSASSILLHEENKAAILISDGRINTGTLEDAFRVAQSHQMVVHTIGIGTGEGGATGFGQVSTIDEDSLRALAHSTGGNYFRAESAQDLQNALNELAELREGMGVINLSRHLTITSVILFVLVFFLINTRYRKLP